MATESDFLGLTKKNAQDKAERMDLIFRLIRIDGEQYFGYPEEGDVRHDRVCVEIDNTKITKVVLQ